MIESSIAGDCSVSRSYSLRDATRKSAAGLRRLGSRLSSMLMAYVAPKLAPRDSRASVTLHQLGDFQGVLQRAEDASDKIHAADDRNRATLSLPLPCAATTSPSSDSTWPGSHSFATDLHRSSPTRPANRARRYDGSRCRHTTTSLRRHLVGLRPRHGVFSAGSSSPVDRPASYVPFG
jgi:hypothetical protein